MRLLAFLRIAVILALVLGAIALECTLYKAFDDNWRRLDVPAAASALGLFDASHAKEPSSHAPADH
jgi:hypothetical protein